MNKVWEVLLLAIVACIAARVVLSVLEPMLPALIGIAILLLVAVSLFQRNRRW